jgi:hypothetical protein
VELLPPSQTKQPARAPNAEQHDKQEYTKREFNIWEN